MKNYTPPAGSGKASSPSKKKKKAKDPNAPKRAISAYFFFNSEMRPKIKEEDPSLSFGEIGKKIGQMYKEHENKSKYEEMAAKDKERYKREMAEYEAKQQGKDDGVNDEVSSDDDNSDSD